MLLRLDDLRSAFGLGVAGNFAGHLEQAQEAAAFATVPAAGDQAPKGIFPWYVPGDGPTSLSRFPLSQDQLALPAGIDIPQLQMEPEVGLLCGVTYAQGGSVASLAPCAAAAFDDCSLRRLATGKISAGKNWGPDSKGVAPFAFEVGDLELSGGTGTLRVASFLRRADKTEAYGIDSAVTDYSYYGVQLLDWIVDRLNAQTSAPDSPLEDVGALLRDCGSPDTVLIGIGATRYTSYGARTFLQARDEAIVVVYDAGHHSPEQILWFIRDGRDDELEAASILRQTVYHAGP